jgi:hypothetical protein
LSYNCQRYACECALKVKVHNIGTETLKGKDFKFFTQGVVNEDLRVSILIAIILLKARGIFTQVDSHCCARFSYNLL